jgi:hypothetical protein
MTFSRETPGRTVVAAGKSSVLGEVVDVIIESEESDNKGAETETQAVKLENEAFIRGDINQDGKLDAIDITMWERSVAGLVIFPDGEDANGDGVINALDIAKLERIITGLD